MRLGDRYAELPVKTWLKRYAPKTKKDFSPRNDLSAELDLRKLKVKATDPKAEVDTYAPLVRRDRIFTTRCVHVLFRSTTSLPLWRAEG